MRTGWGETAARSPEHPVAPSAAARRARLAEAFPGERLVLPAGTFKVRSNDTDYRFRPDTAHTYYSGNQSTDAVLVLTDGDAVLYARPRSSRRPTSSSGTGSTARCGPGGARPWRRCRPRWAWRSGTSTTCPRRWPGAARPACTAASRPPWTRWCRRGGPGLRPRPGGLRDAAGQGRLGGRRAARGLRHHDPGLRGLGARVGPGPRARRALDRGHLLPPCAGDGQRHRLRLDRGRRLATPRRCTGSTTRARSRPASWCCSTWASRAATSTPPT